MEDTSKQKKKFKGAFTKKKKNKNNDFIITNLTNNINII